MDVAELQSLKIKELTKLAQDMNAQDCAGLKKTGVNCNHPESTGRK